MGMTLTVVTAYTPSRCLLRKDSGQRRSHEVWREELGEEHLE